MAVTWRWRLRGDALNWTEFAKTIGTTTVALGVIGYFLRGVFGQVLSRDLEKFKADLSAKHDIEIERLRNDLRITASEHETRFTRLHETRVETIAELYKRFVRAHEAFDAYLRRVQFGGEADHVKKGEEAAKCGREFGEYFSEKRIYFEEGLCGDIDAAFGQFLKVWIEMGAYPPGMPGRGEQWSQTALHFIDHFPPIRAKIERQFRDLIGVKEAQSNGQRTPGKGLLPP
jgi:hypothetical protein